MEWICDRYRAGATADVAAMSDTLKLDLSTATRLTELFAEANLVIYVRENGVILPARPLENITVAEALRVGFRVASIDRGSGNGDFVDTLRTVQLESVGNRTFAASSTCKNDISKAELSGSTS